MQGNKVSSILHWWVGNKLPVLHVLAAMNPFKKWLIHPIKRRVAKYYLVILRKFFGVKVIGITGSVGKTTSKEMIASVLSQRYRVRATYANIDPIYNIPNTILKCNPRTQMLVLEMGIEHPGEMDFYFWLATPDVGILTNIYYTHTLFLGGIEGVAREKGKIIKGLPKNAWAVLNADDRRVLSLKKETQAKTLLFGTKPTAQINAQNVKITEDLKTQFTLILGKTSEHIILSLVGNHWIYAALAAVSVGEIFDVPIEKIKVGLEAIKPQTHRMVPILTKKGAIILNDTYNSSPLGAIAAINVLAKVGSGRKKIAVLGDMLELGDYEKKGHNEVGFSAAKSGVDILFCVGDKAEYISDGAVRGGMDKSNIFIFKRAAEATLDITKLLDKNVVILFKASRKLKFDEIVEQFKKY